MASGKDPKVRKLSKKEARELFKLPWILDEALSTYNEARVLPDGRVLWHNPEIGGYTFLYPSRAVVEEVNRALAETERKAAEQSALGAPDPCFELLPPVDDFIRDVDAHAKSLGKKIKVADDALDRSLASLDAVDKGLKRIPWAKRPVPEILTPLVAYVGEVMRRVSGGRWSQRPTGWWEKEVTIFDPAEVLAFHVARRKLQPIADATADKAGAEAKARGASADEVDLAKILARRALFEELEAAKAPKPIRVEPRKYNEPVIVAANEKILSPFGILYVPMHEPSKRLPLRQTVEWELATNGYPQTPKASA
jgi:hypothetical protein